MERVQSIVPKKPIMLLLVYTKLRTIELLLENAVGAHLAPVLRPTCKY
jgi:hypothetical protein